jgi:hypothetical protein
VGELAHTADDRRGLHPSNELIYTTLDVHRHRALETAYSVIVHATVVSVAPISHVRQGLGLVLIRECGRIDAAIQGFVESDREAISLM